MMDIFKNFVEKSIPCLGEPTASTAEVAVNCGIPTLQNSLVSL